jgi:hypothetical protein
MEEQSVEKAHTKDLNTNSCNVSDVLYLSQTTPGTLTAEVPVTTVSYVKVRKVIAEYVDEKGKHCYSPIMQRDMLHQYPFETDEVITSDGRKIFYLDIDHALLCVVKKMLGIDPKGIRR